jgi:hypothetical protein
MLDLFKKNPEDEQKPVEEMPAEASVNGEDTLLSMLDRLYEEEKTLLTEKSQLMDMEGKLRLKITEEIESKKRIIEDLRAEIPELKQKCETLAQALEIPVYK